MLNELKVENLRKQWGDFTLQAQFSIQEGERAALVGRSGSGKTTLLRLIAGLETLAPPSESGKIFLGGREITALPPQKREIGYVFQDQALFSHLNVMENVTFGLQMRGVSKEQREKEGLIWLERVGLASLRSAPVGQLSGGEKQRVAFIRALIWKPKLLLLDEPFSALDAELRKKVRAELIELHKIWPVPMLLVTHDEADIQAVANVSLQLECDPSTNVREVKRPRRSELTCEVVIE